MCRRGSSNRRRISQIDPVVEAAIEEAGQPLEVVRRIRDELYHHVWELIETLVPSAPASIPARSPSGAESGAPADRRTGGNIATACATLSHMEIGVRDLRNRTSQVIDAVQAGERVTLTVHGEPIADIVPHGRRARWLSGEHLRDQLRDRAADPNLTRDLDDLAGQTLDEL